MIRSLKQTLVSKLQTLPQPAANSLIAFQILDAANNHEQRQLVPMFDQNTIIQLWS
jgi:hypothetical protein